MCGSSAPEDHSAEVAAINAKAAADARAAQEAADAKKQAEFDARMNSAFGSGLQSANDFFAQRGLDPNDYSGAISTRLQQIKSAIPNLDANPGSYYEGAGSNIWDSLSQALQGKDQRIIDTLAPTGFATNRIADTADDQTIADILNQQEKSAQDYANNLRTRGVITDSGLKAALDNITGQVSGARTKLSDLGMGIINKGRGDAENLANTARAKAAKEQVGSTWDPYSTGTDLNNFFTNFFSGLGDNLRGIAPTNLFDTSGLANIAGAAGGAGNNAFNPAAVAGGLGAADDTTDDDNKTTTNPF